MGDDRRPAGQATFTAVHAGHRAEQREKILDTLRNPPADGWAVVSNVRVLSEGVNIPELDAIAFGHPKKSTVDIVQAVGRALRGGGEGEIATIIVPIVVPSADDDVTDLDPGDYQVLWDVVRALRTHDERLGTQLDRARYHPEAGIGAEHPPPLPERISVYLPPGAADTVLDQLTVLTVRQSTSSWMESYGAAVRYHAEHGHLLVPGDHRTADGVRLGAWVKAQRANVASLTPRRRALLDDLGMVWDVREAQWMRYYTAARGVHARTGELRIAVDAQVDGLNLGAWLATQRHQRAKGRLSPDRVALLNELGMWWSAFDAGLQACDRYIAHHGHLDVLTSYVDDHGYPLGTWLAKWRAKPGTLDAEQRAELNARGMIWSKAPDTRDLTAADKDALLHTRDHGTSADLTRLIIDLVDNGAVQRHIAETLGVSPSAIRNRLKTKDPELDKATRAKNAWLLSTQRQAIAELAETHPDEAERLYANTDPGPNRRARANDRLRQLHPDTYATILAAVRERDSHNNPDHTPRTTLAPEPPPLPQAPTPHTPPPPQPSWSG
jgi:hypothetical protein